MAAEGGHLGFLRSKVICSKIGHNFAMKADIGVIFFLMISSPSDQPDNVGLVLVGMLVLAQEKQINIFISYFIKKFKSCFF